MFCGREELKELVGLICKCLYLVGIHDVDIARDCATIFDRRERKYDTE